MYDFVSGLNVCVFCSRRLYQCGLLSKYIRTTFLRISSCTSLGASQTSKSLSSFCSKNSDFLFWNSKSLSLATWVMVNAGRHGANLYLKEGPLPLVNGQSVEELLYRVIVMDYAFNEWDGDVIFLSVRRTD